MPLSKTVLISKALCRFWPRFYRLRLTQWAKAHNLQVPVFILSFDCDTDRDAAAAVVIQKKLHKAGIPAAYAVPGALLQDHWDQYKQLPDLGGYFINHGYRRHAEIDPQTNKAVTTFGYASQPIGIWSDDIQKGHDAIIELTGHRPEVFRTPHFGSFLDSQVLRDLYAFLKKNGYKLSSSTTPTFAACYGSVYTVENGIHEVPLSGCLGKPNQLIDSWGFLGASDALGCKALLSALQAYHGLMTDGIPLFLNLYFDPADIVDLPQIIEELCAFAPWATGRLDPAYISAVTKVG